MLFSPPSDTTAVCILETFGHQPSMMLADKMLKEIGKERAGKKFEVGRGHFIAFMLGYYIEGLEPELSM